MPVVKPAVLTGIKIGYARVSTGGQNLERQIDALNAVGCRQISAVSSKLQGTYPQDPDGNIYPENWYFVK